MTATSAISPGQKLSPDHLAKVLEEFHREGVAVVPNVLSPDECAALRDSMDRVFSAKAIDNTRGPYSVLVRGGMATYDSLYRDMIVREPFVSLAELRRHRELAGMRLLQKGNRLSITPVDPLEWKFISGKLLKP